MIKLQGKKGAITISDAVFTNITGNAATNCFGVKGMAFRSMTDGLVHLLRKEAMSKGVQVHPPPYHRRARHQHHRRLPLHYERGAV